MGRGRGQARRQLGGAAALSAAETSNEMYQRYVFRYVLVNASLDVAWLERNHHTSAQYEGPTARVCARSMCNFRVPGFLRTR